MYKLVIYKSCMVEGEAMEKTGLILQGGGMRGIYTSGVIDYFIENDLYFPYVIGVSAGACNGSAYIARQKEYGKKSILDFVDRPNFLSFRNLIKTKNIFDMDFIFDEMPKKHNVLDTDTLMNANERFIAVATDCYTGKPIYLEKHNCSDIQNVLRASSSVPVVSKKVIVNDMHLLDGGVSDPIPVKKSIGDGNKKNIVVMTENLKYMKKAKIDRILKWVASSMYNEHKEMLEILLNYHEFYNKVIDEVKDYKHQGKAFIIEPSKDIKIDMFGKNKTALRELYEIGYEDAKHNYKDMISYIYEN